MRYFPSFALAVMLLNISNLKAYGTAPAPKTIEFPLSSVRLLDGPFKNAMILDGKYLLSLDTDRLLTGFRTNAGFQTNAKSYGGWESRGLAGQSLGHYLSACSMMYAATGDIRFKDQVDRVVSALAQCQDAAGNGFIGGMPRGREIFAQFSRGDLQTNGGFSLNDSWVPWYNQHKLFAGLRDAYLYTDNAQAKIELTKLGEWAIDVCSNLTDAQMQNMLSVEHGGMMETLADLYAITADPKFLSLSERFWHKAALDPLAEGKDDLTGMHANATIPKVIGAARLYEITGEPRFAATAGNFWNAVVKTRSFVTGSNSDREHFFALGLEAGKLGPENGETCNVYNMLKLTSHLAHWSGQAEYYDYYELALFNHILGSIDPDTGMCTYFQSLEPGRFKVYGTPTNSFWCCTGTGMENHAKYGSEIYSRRVDSASIDVNLFIASQVAWAEKGLVLRQETDFPASDSSRLVLKLEKPAQFTLRIRVPGWAEHGIEVSGATVEHAPPGSGYITLNRTWQNGDAITIRMPMTLRLHRAEDDSTMTAAVFGPVVLAAQLGREDFPKTDNVSDHTSFDLRPIPTDVVPTIVTGEPVTKWLLPELGKPLHFKTAGAGRPFEIEFAPLFTTHHTRYAVYLRTVTVADYKATEKKVAADKEASRALAARTIDEVTFGEQQSELDHAIASDKSNTGNFQNRPWRDTTGFFSVKLKLRPDVKQVLRCEYWGGDVNRTFDINADGKVLATQSLRGEHPDHFFSVDYPIPESLTRHEHLTVEFRAHAGSIGGGVFVCSVLQAGNEDELLKPLGKPSAP